MSAKFNSIDEYIASVAPDARPILKKIRSTVTAAVPKATETISCGYIGRELASLRNYDQGDAICKNIAALKRAYDRI